MAANTDHHPDASTTSLLKPIEYQSALSKSSESFEQPEYRYSYADENFNYYPSQNAAFTEEKAHVPQLANAVRESRYEDFDDAEPFVISSRASSVREKRPNPFEKYFGFYPLEQRIEDKKRGIGVQKYPIVVWTLSAVMLGVLIYELVVNAKAQGSPFSFKPVVNPMLGPSPSALIHVGARFPPCMKDVQGLSSSTSIACLNDTANPPDKICSIEDVCGFGGFHDQTPNQWFRFITPIFLHAGLIHFLLNMLAQLTCSAQVEREMGSIGFLVLYAAAGIFGNVLGGSFSLVESLIFSVRLHGWMFAHWRYQYRPGRKLAFMAIELIIGIAIGYIPYVDNFASSWWPSNGTSRRDGVIPNHQPLDETQSHCMVF
ncbi:hypothetical protein A0H81_00820 [Grifola frondosa]|uniref:Rhomboid-type serine protease n=1 Tax=Grifola frondosa TaxID=5627 RepID=A0A1C7MRC5_GRIFR|nr:hypothetical protein A0H81_00820 [Grifola frondosa]